jgi:hypothetical protein
VRLTGLAVGCAQLNSLFATRPVTVTHSTTPMDMLFSALTMVPQIPRGNTQWLGTTMTGVDQYLYSHCFGQLGATLEVALRLSEQNDEATEGTRRRELPED